ncbi:hypothetical protein ACFX19_022705 [Malus domestica]
MAKELQALHENNTWTIVKLPKRKKAVGSRWVYKTKFHLDGTIERNKVGLLKDLLKPMEWITKRHLLPWQR